MRFKENDYIVVFRAPNWAKCWISSIGRVTRYHKKKRKYCIEWFTDAEMYDYGGEYFADTWIDENCIKLTPINLWITILNELYEI